MRSREVHPYWHVDFASPWLHLVSQVPSLVMLQVLTSFQSQLKGEHTFVQHFVQDGGAASSCTKFKQPSFLPAATAWGVLDQAACRTGHFRPTWLSHQSCSTRAFATTNSFSNQPPPSLLRFGTSRQIFPFSHQPPRNTSNESSKWAEDRKPTPIPTPSPQKKIGTGGMVSAGDGRSPERLAGVGDVKSAKTPETDPSP